MHSLTNGMGRFLGGIQFEPTERLVRREVVTSPYLDRTSLPIIEPNLLSALPSIKSVGVVSSCDPSRGKIRGPASGHLFLVSI